MTSEAARSVFGFAIESEIPFRFLRRGGGRDVLRVDEAPSGELAQQGRPVFEWRFKDPTGDVSATLHHTDGIYHLWTADVGWFRIDPVARQITVPREADPVRRELRLWGVPTTLCSIQRGDASLHAAAVEVDGGAVLLAAPGQYGKTTLAMAFHTNGYRVLSEDVSCCLPGAMPMLVPGPASLRVRPDMFDGTAPPGSEVASINPDRIFLRLDADRAGSSEPLPIRAILFLRWSEGEIRLERLEKTRALPDVWALSFRVPGSITTGELFGRVAPLVAGTSVWNLHRPKRLHDLDEVVRVIAGMGTA